MLAISAKTHRALANEEAWRTDPARRLTGRGVAEQTQCILPLPAALIYSRETLSEAWVGYSETKGRRPLKSSGLRYKMLIRRRVIPEN